LIKALNIKDSLMDALIVMGACFLADCKSKATMVAILRAIRSSRVLFMPQLHKKLLNNMAYQSHLEKIDKNDAIFFLSHRHYVARGLTTLQRIQTAVFHYEYEINRFDKAYIENVYRKQGLTLWQDTVNDTTFDIRLMMGNDILYEGGCSLVLHVDGGRVCVISYSIVPREIFFLKDASSSGSKNLEQSVIFVTRKQLASDHAYQNAFNKAFDRTTPTHLCISALTGIALAQGYDCFIGISAEAHPALTDEYQRNFDVAYTQFWKSLNGQRLSPYGYLIDLPMSLTSLDDLEPKARKRAIKRRQHGDNVYTQAHSVIQKHLLNVHLRLP
jgi:uncharacterized protein